LASEYPPYLIPHSENGEPHCPGLLFAVPREGVADFECNDCGAVVFAVPLAEVPTAIQDMRVDSGDGVALFCPHCGETNEFPGHSEMFTFTCSHCGKGVVVTQP
jgi:hypothetical protein